ncbi:MAG: amidohydrolase [Phycisphaerales bacterium]|nr:amidohydrolase [Phycisphaerales bacterium]
MASLRCAAAALSERLVAFRRHLHAHPELSGQEEETARFVADRLRALGLEPQERLGGTYGVSATLPAGSGPVVALRADMDALPIEEESDIPYRSQRPGVMHACGHDAHTAMLLGAAELLVERRAELLRPVRFIFQPSEESPPGGAQPMIAAGVLEGVARAYGVHIWSEMPCGTLGTRPGPFMSGVTNLRVIFNGRGGHAAMPQQCIDPIVVLAEFILAAQTVVSRSLAMTDSAVVTITRVQAGSTHNVIPSRAEAVGTLRALSEEVAATVTHRLRELAEGIARAHGATVEIVFQPGYPPLVNDGGAVTTALDLARELGWTEEQIMLLAPQGGAEDFAYYAAQVPSAFLFLGARNEALDCRYPHHHPRFNVDEAALPLGVALLARLGMAG